MHRSLALAPLFLTACVAPQPAPRPAPEPVAPLPAAGPPPRVVGWQDGPAAPGDWTWARAAGGSVATFGVAGRAAVLTARCDTARRTITLAVPGPATAGAALTVQTSDGARSFPVAPTGAAPASVATTIPAGDGFLDRIAFSRGRFRIQLGGGAPVVIPAWPEFARTVEDCRP